MEIKDVYELELETLEHAISLEYWKSINIPSELKVNIPKIMPLIPVSSPHNRYEALNTNILINSKETRPKVGSRITVSNYITARRCNFRIPGVEIFLGTSVNCLFVNKNIKDAKFTII